MDPAVRKRVLRILDYDLVVVGVRRKEVRNEAKDRNAFLGSWVTQCSFDPPLLALAVRKDGHSAEMIRESGVFSVNVLSVDQKALAAKFLRDLEIADGAMSGVPYRLEKTGAPIFPSLAGWVECEVRHVWDEGDHVLFVGEVVEAGTGEAPAKSLTTRETGWSYAG